MRVSFRMIKKILILNSACAVLPLLLNTSVQAAGNASQGADVFSSECADCHSVKLGKNKKGPSLFGVIGRAAGSIADAKYSDALMASKITWSVDSIDKYLAHPKALIPGGKMKYDGLPDAKKRADLISYLAAQK